MAGARHTGMEKEDLDLIPDGSRSRFFKVTFDYYTPRAHFVLSELHRGRARIGQDFGKIPLRLKREIIRLANVMISEYDLPQGGVFSIHCGSWTTNDHTFHAFICVDVDDYIRLFYRRENEIPNWPSRSFVTREWKASRNPSEYVKNVRGYPYKEYFKAECQGIRRFIEKEQRREDEGKAKHRRVCPTIDENYGNFEGFLVVYHPSEPRVGFVLNTREHVNQDDHLRALDAMYKFAEASKLTNLKTKGEDKGCHICLVLDQQTQGFPLNSAQRLLGFIQVSGTKFYKDFCPEDAKESWFLDFGSREDYKVYT
ncbi:uncharacterized protein LOC116300958 [Actinia tenebrosa]|uniref:Uncharacterized protein LOC116300958 n=1 Tax=Actinia tenebrosa TaxID=6105 RepID=A0A6P8IGJ1_ACTTE|nr:uncharacterized protein LOC116300958 [Actinia tenebrosa]